MNQKKTMEHIKEIIHQLKRPTQTTSQSSVSIEDFKKVIYEVCPNFKVSPENKEILNELFRYTIGKSEILDPKKGIWFWGSIGTGKSTLMKILAEVQRTDGRGFKCVNCSELTTKFSAHGLGALNESTFNEMLSAKPVERGFDEVGREPIPAKYFGNDLNVVQYSLGMRYELRNIVKTHVTTNMKKESISLVYGDYIFDRLNEMFNFIEIKGESKR